MKATPLASGPGSGGQDQLEFAYRFYPGGCHEILNEREKDQVYRDIAHWLTHVLDR